MSTRLDVQRIVQWVKMDIKRMASRQMGQTDCIRDVYRITIKQNGGNLHAITRSHHKADSVEITGGSRLVRRNNT